MSSAGLFVALERAREVQASYTAQTNPRTGRSIYVAAVNATAPDLCLAASKFVAGKLAGFYKVTSHLNDLVLNRARAPGKDRMAPSQTNHAWGHITGNESFNKTALAASLTKEAGIANPDWVIADAPMFRHGIGNKHVAEADQLLNQGAPLVVGVSLHGKGERDHFVCVVKSMRDGSAWLVDSWEDRDVTTPGIYRLSDKFSFAQPMDLVTDGSATTRLPCHTMYLGYYQGRTTRRPFTAVELDADADAMLIRPA